MSTSGSSFAQTRMGRSPRCYIPNSVEIDLPVLVKVFRIRNPQCYISSFVEIGLPVPAKKIFERFLPYMGVAATLVM